MQYVYTLIKFVSTDERMVPFNFLHIVTTLSESLAVVGMLRVGTF